MKTLGYLWLLCLPLITHAQIQVGSNQIATANRPGKIKPAELERLKQTTTLFTFPYKSYEDLEAYEAAIRSVWTLTPFKVIKPDEMKSFMGQEGYSFFSFGGFITVRENAGANNMHLAYDLWLPGKGGKGRHSYFARIMIYPDNQTFFTAMRNVNRRKDDFSSRMLSFVYNDAVLYNWGPGFLKGYLRKVNDQLLAKDERGPYSEEADKPALARLKTDTLYIPDYVFIKFNMFVGSEKKDEEADESDLGKTYPFPVKIVPAEELNKMILTAQTPFLYLTYTKSSTDKYINVYSSEGNLLYARYTALSYNFKYKDLGKLAKLID